MHRTIRVGTIPPIPHGAVHPNLTLHEIWCCPEVKLNPISYQCMVLP